MSLSNGFLSTSEPFDFSTLDLAVLMVHDEIDIMEPGMNAAHLQVEISNSKVVLYKGAGHGYIFKWLSELVDEALAFLNQETLK